MVCVQLRSLTGALVPAEVGIIYDLITLWISKDCGYIVCKDSGIGVLDGCLWFLTKGRTVWLASGVQAGETSVLQSLDGQEMAV